MLYHGKEILGWIFLNIYDKLQLEIPNITILNVDKWLLNFVGFF